MVGVVVGGSSVMTGGELFVADDDSLAVVLRGGPSGVARGGLAVVAARRLGEAVGKSGLLGEGS